VPTRKAAPEGFVTAAPGLPGARLVSLDIFRGLTIAGMILVNDPGSWSSIYWPLDHAPWNGWTPTDLIFPFFLFIVGVAMVFSFGMRTERGASRGMLAWHVLRRSVIIFALGLFLNGFPYFHLSRLRISGVLQRISVCYLFAGLIVLLSGLGYEKEVGRTAQAGGPERRPVIVISLVILVLLVGYWALMTFVPVPGYGAGRLDPDGNLAAYVDRWLMLGHLWKPTWDPEGVLSTLPAIATVLIGVLVGVWLRTPRTQPTKVVGLLAVGVAGLIQGRLLDPLFPINKNLWTSSYVIFTAGFAMVLLAVIYWVVDVRGYRRWGAPFLVFGMNSILAFTLSTWLAKCSIVFKVTRGDGRMVTWHNYVYGRFFEGLASPKNASLLFALAYVLLWLAVMWLFYHRRIFVRI
jgi:predicted acyltransferase